jgi:predicted DNA-binding protein
MPSINISKELMRKIEKIAAKKGCSADDCAEYALGEYIENFEDFYRTDLDSVSSTERSFFLNING